jgi:hypothetical protein
MRGLRKRSLATPPSGLYMTFASCPPRVDDKPRLTLQVLSGTTMMLYRRPSLSVIVFCIAGVMTIDNGGNWVRKSSPNAFWFGARPPSTFSGHLNTWYPHPTMQKWQVRFVRWA